MTPDATSSPESPTAVRGSAIEVRYGTVTAIAASDFTVPAGKVTAIIGPNGSGKSTLLVTMVGLRTPSSGEISVLGTTPVKARPRIAFVPQSTKVSDTLPVTVREVVAMGRYATLGLVSPFRAPDRTAVDEAIGRLDLTAVSSRHLGELSGGQRQRVFVAQGLVQDRSMLLMDEPLNALDLVSAAVISTVVAEERAAGRTVVVTTHDLADAAEADHVLLLAGTVVAEGPPAEVLTSEHLSSAYQSQIIEADGRLILDDAAHRPTASRHVHVDLPAAAHPHPHDD